MSSTPFRAQTKPGDRALVVRTFGQPRFRCDGDVLALGFAADGSVYSVEEPGVLRRWSESGEPLERHFLSDLETPWWFSPDSSRVAAACDELMIWQTATRQLTARIEQPSWITSVAFHPSDDVVATGHDDGVVRLWQISTEELVAELAEGEQPISAIAFDATGGRLASASEDRVINLWDVASQKPFRKLEGHTDRIPGVAWQPGGRFLVSVGWDNTARVWDVDTGEPRILLNTHDDQVEVMTFSPNGLVLATADSASTVHLWGDLLTAQVVHRLPGYAEEVRALAFSRDGKRIAIGGNDRAIHLYDVPSGRLLAGRPSDSRHSIAFLDRPRPTLLSNAGDDGVQAWDVETSASVPSPMPAGDYRYVATSPDGRWVAATGADASLHLWDESTQSHRKLEGSRTPGNFITFSADSKSFAVAATEEGTVWVWDVNNTEPRLLVIEATEGCCVESVAFHPNGRLLLCGGIDFLSTSGAGGAVCIWDLAERKRVVSVADGATAVTFDPTGKWFAFATPDGPVVLADAETGDTALELDGPEEGSLTALAFSSDGTALFGTAKDGTFRVWDSRTGRVLTLREFPAALHGVVLRPDGRAYVANENTTVFELDTTQLTDAS